VNQIQLWRSKCTYRGQPVRIKHSIMQQPVSPSSPQDSPGILWRQECNVWGEYSHIQSQKNAKSHPEE
jgi:hypothetical protein